MTVTSGEVPIIGTVTVSDTSSLASWVRDDPVVVGSGDVWADGSDASYAEVATQGYVSSTNTGAYAGALSATGPAVPEIPVGARVEFVTLRVRARWDDGPNGRAQDSPIDLGISIQVRDMAEFGTLAMVGGTDYEEHDPPLPNFPVSWKFGGSWATQEKTSTPYTVDWYTAADFGGDEAAFQAWVAEQQTKVADRLRSGDYSIQIFGGSSPAATPLGDAKDTQYLVSEVTLIWHLYSEASASVGQLYVNTNPEGDPPEWTSVCPVTSGPVEPFVSSFTDTNFFGAEGAEDWWMPGGNTLTILPDDFAPRGWDGAPIGTTTGDSISVQVVGDGAGTLRLELRGLNADANEWILRREVEVSGPFTFDWTPVVSEAITGAEFFTMADMVYNMNNNTSGGGVPYLEIKVVNLETVTGTITLESLVFLGEVPGGSSGSTELAHASYVPDYYGTAPEDSGFDETLPNLGDGNPSTYVEYDSAWHTSSWTVLTNPDPTGLVSITFEVDVTVTASGNTNTGSDWPSVDLILTALDGYDLSGGFLNTSGAEWIEIRGSDILLNAGIGTPQTISQTMDAAWLAAHPLNPPHADGWSTSDSVGSPGSGSVLTLERLVYALTNLDLVFQLWFENPTYTIQVSALRVSITTEGGGGFVGYLHDDAAALWYPYHFNLPTVNDDGTYNELGAGAAESSTALEFPVTVANQTSGTGADLADDNPSTGVVVPWPGSDGIWDSGQPTLNFNGPTTNTGTAGHTHLKLVFEVSDTAPGNAVFCHFSVDDATGSGSVSFDTEFLASDTVDALSTPSPGTYEFPVVLAAITLNTTGVSWASDAELVQWLFEQFNDPYAGPESKMYGSANPNATNVAPMTFSEFHLVAYTPGSPATTWMPILVNVTPGGTPGEWWYTCSHMTATP